MAERTYTTRILLVGGGTGGHFYPLIAVAEVLNTLPDKPKLFYAGPHPYDAGALANESITFVSVPAGKQRRYFSLFNIFDMFKTFLGMIVALIKLFIVYPDVIMSKGGYTSVPITCMARFLRIPVIIHESDAVMGRANVLGSTFARHIVTTYSETILKSKRQSVLTLGIPIRRALLTLPTQDTHQMFSLDSSLPVILVLGGSQGAERVNELILDTLDELLPKFSIIHQTGAKNYETCKLSAQNLVTDEVLQSRYHPFPFFDAPTLNNAYHLATIVVSRAGSGSIYEIATHGKPAILIPIPEEISHDQRTNAYAYAREGGATVMEEMNLTDSLLRAEIERIMQSGEIYEKMASSARAFGKRDSAEHIARLLMEVAGEHVR